MGYKGIKYRSSIIPDNFNIALFCSVNPYITAGVRNAGYNDFGITPFTEWLNLKKVDYVKCGIAYNLIESTQHDDSKAEYKKYTRYYKEIFEKFNI